MGIDEADWQEMMSYIPEQHKRGIRCFSHPDYRPFEAWHYIVLAVGATWWSQMEMSADVRRWSEWSQAHDW